MTMTKTQIKEVLDGVVNQLDSNDKAELLQKALDTMTIKQKKKY